MANIFLYNHIGSGNHGCEALVRTVSKLLCNSKRVITLSENPKEEEYYDLHENILTFPATNQVKKNTIPFMKAFVKLKLTGNYFDLDVLPYCKAISKLNHDDIGISIGGDVYCYENYPKYIKIHEKIKKRSCKTVLLGCSLEETLFKDKNFIKDLDNYELIIARESLTYSLLKKYGFTKIELCPDSAFTLECKYLPLPEGFQEGETVGINISPLVIRKESKEKIIYKNLINLIDYILKNTNYSIALIPHVVWQDNDDRTILSLLKEEFINEKRVIQINDCNCMQLKGFISRCKFFIGSRTHATIAAYSTCVPTIALGYSIKSKGIAKDIFGTHSNYVLPIQDIVEEDELIKSFKWLQHNELSIKKHLNSKMPDYIKKAHSLSNIIEKYIALNEEKKKSISIKDKEKCCGCTACLNACPKNAITMTNDSEGFSYPIVNHHKCINCGICTNVCPILNTSQISDFTKAYACYSKNQEIVLKSSSGGLAYIISQYIISNGGIVYGAAFDEKWNVTHKKISSIQELKYLKGSKYAQSNLDYTFSDVKQELIKGKTILFTGTNCQIQGLLEFLCKKYVNLYTLDIACHGVPSNTVWNKYLTEITNGIKISSYLQREKSLGIKHAPSKIILSNGNVLLEEYSENLFQKGFIMNFYLRPSCYVCNFKGLNRNSDITIGDYWGIENEHPDFGSKYGTSFALIHSNKGMLLFNQISDKLNYIQSETDKILRHNPAIIYSSNLYKNDRDYFFKYWQKKGFINTVNELTNPTIITKIKNKLL